MSLKIEDLACSHCGKNGTIHSWFEKLDMIFYFMGWKANRLLSGYRCEAHERAVGGTGRNHPKGFAADVRVSPGAELKEFMAVVFSRDVRRLIVYPGRGFVHIDDNPDRPEGLWFG